MLEHHELAYAPGDPRNPALLSSQLRGSLERYVSDGIPPGDFLAAVISNDLIEAYLRADIRNTALLPALAAYVYHQMPADSWGSRRVYFAWLALHNAQRVYRRAVSAGEAEAIAAASARKEQSLIELRDATHLAHESTHRTRE